MLKYSVIITVVVLFGCTHPKDQKIVEQSITASLIDKDTVVHTPYSTLENQYHGFNSPQAINAIARIENEYFRRYKDSFSPYYGTVWRTDVIPNKP